MDILNKIMLFLLIMSSLNVIRNGFFLFRSIREGEKFSLSTTSLIFLGMSLSFILLSLIDGVKI